MNLPGTLAVLTALLESGKLVEYFCIRPSGCPSVCSNVDLFGCPSAFQSNPSKNSSGAGVVRVVCLSRSGHASKTHGGDAVLQHGAELNEC